MNEQVIKEERERSARKKAEIDAEVNSNREIVYNYIASRKDVVGKTCVEELGFFAKGQRYLEWLTLHGHLLRTKRTIGGKRLYVYTALTPYVKPKTIETETVSPLANSALRVVRLLDREQMPQHKTERPKRSSGVMSGMQSSMRMFGSW